MLFSADYFLQSNTPYFSPHLVSGQALANILPIAKALPPVTNIALECRLQAEHSGVDFIPQFAARGGSREALIQQTAVDPVWSRIQALCQEWARPESILQTGVREIWLEFDVATSTPPPPSLFIGFRKKQTPTQDQQMSVATLEILDPRLLSLALSDNLGHCFNRLPIGASLFSIGVMVARAYDHVRVCVGNVGKEQVLPYLQAIGWPGDFSQWQLLLHDLLPLVDEFGLALDVGETISPKLGLECYLFETNPRKEPRWEQLLDYLVTHGQCAPDKKAGLLNWPGRFFHGLSPEEAAAIKNTAVSLPPRSQSLFTRKISHIKLVNGPGLAPETKAYLELNSTWIPIGQSA